MSYCSHDPSASLIKYSQDGKADFIHFEEGMLSRRKKSYHFPLRSIHSALEHYGIGIEDVDVVTVDYMDHQRFSNTATYYRKLVGDYIRRQLKLRPDQLNFASSHHAAHAYSAYYSSGFDEAAVIAIDGLGSEQQTHSVFVGRRGRKIEKIFSQATPGIGELYTLVTTALGFEAGEEGKTMGLAPYGHDLRFENEPDFSGRYQGLLTDYSRIVRRSPSAKLKLALDHEKLQQDIYTGYPARVAYLLQRELETSLLHLVKATKDATGCKKLCIAGGVGLNCVANEIIARSGIFDEVYVHADSGDAGLPHGLAMMGLMDRLPEPEGFNALEGMSYPIFSPQTRVTRNVNTFKDIVAAHNIPTTPFDCDAVAEHLCNERVICLYTGGWEYGPRALGHRSFLADPRSERMKEVMNIKIKHREPYRPFAPIVLGKHFKDYFISTHANHDRMLYAVGVTALAEKCIPAVVHFDKTARAQTINDPNEPAFQILQAFQRKTGVPVLINTSFNDNNEPIVMSPLDALKCFLNTDADVLIVEDVMLCRHDIEPGVMAALRHKLEQELHSYQVGSYREAAASLLNRPDVSLQDFLATRLLSSLFHRYRASYERLVSEMIDLLQSDEERRVLLDGYHRRVLENVAEEFKLDIFNNNLTFSLIDDDASALTEIRGGDVILAYNLCAILNQEKRDGNSFGDVNCFYASCDPIIEIEAGYDGDLSAQMEAIEASYEVDLTKNIALLSSTLPLIDS